MAMRAVGTAAGLAALLGAAGCMSMGDGLIVGAAQDGCDNYPTGRQIMECRDRQEEIRREAVEARRTSGDK
jgi:hypothetical protein